MGHGDFFRTFWGDLARGNCLYPFKDICRVVAIPTLVTNPKHHILQDDKALFVLEGFALHDLLSNGPIAIFATIFKFARHVSGSVTSYTVMMR